MGKRDYWAKWAEHNKDYWAKWAEHNKDYWNNPQAHRHARHFGRGRMFGRIVIFGLGFGAGVLVNQRYKMPSIFPVETRVEIRTAIEKLKKDHPGFHENSEYLELVEKIKQLEKKLRRQPPTDESQPSTSDSSAPYTVAKTDTPVPRSSE